MDERTGRAGPVGVRGEDSAQDQGEVQPAQPAKLRGDHDSGEDGGGQQPEHRPSGPVHVGRPQPPDGAGNPACRRGVDLVSRVPSTWAKDVWKAAMPASSRVCPTSPMSIPALARACMSCSASWTPRSIVRASVPWSSKACSVFSGRVLTVSARSGCRRTGCRGSEGSWSMWTPTVGVHIDQEPSRPRHPVRRQPDRADTVNTLPENTLQAFEDHGTLARTIDLGVQEAEHDMHALANAGIDMGDVGHTLEEAGIAAFQTSFAHVLGTLDTKSTPRRQAGLPAPSGG